MEEQDKQEPTFGMKAVGIDFNPSGDPNVNRIKMQCANIIDTLEEFRQRAIVSADTEKVHMYSIAITDIQSGQMWGVKAVTWKY